MKERSAMLGVFYFKTCRDLKKLWNFASKKYYF